MNTDEADCCVVGAGPAGSVLAYLLARAGLRVILLEARDDFERDFRGDTFHPLLLEIMEDLGLAERILALSQSKITRAVAETPDGSFTIYDFTRLRTRYPYMSMIPQARFLTLINEEAAGFPGFELRMGAHVHGLIKTGNVVEGVRYRCPAGDREIRATLTIGADGRSSAVRRHGGFDLVESPVPMDVLWFRLPRAADHPTAGFRTVIGPGALMVMFDRGDHWQVGYVIRKGDRRQVREAGLDALRKSVVSLDPVLADSVHVLREWNQIAALTVKSGRVRRWHKPGVLLIGDAAHVMTPIGGVGINVAVQDAVVAFNRLARPLARGHVARRHLASVQRRRRLPVWLIQGFQRQVQRRVASAALDRRFSQPAFSRSPLLRTAITRLLAIGPWRVRVRA